MDLETAVDQVYAAAPEDFMAVRTALVAEARQARDRELARAIGALRKPTRSAWLVNLLARESADEVGSLLDLGAALREAQVQLSGPELRRLSGERQAAVRGLVRRAGDLSAAHGHRATDAQLQEVSQHLQAALGDPALAEDVRRGRVAQIVTVGGFGMWEAGPLTAASAAPGPSGAGAEQADAEPTSQEGPAEREPAQPSDPAGVELDQAHRAWRDAQAAVEEAQRSAAEAATVAERAAGAVQELRERLAELRERLADAERTAAEAEENRRSAERQLGDVRTLAADAEARWERLSG